MAHAPTHRLLPGVLRAGPAGLAGGGCADLLLLGPAAAQAAVAAGATRVHRLRGQRPTWGLLALWQLGEVQHDLLRAYRKSSENED